MRRTAVAIAVLAALPAVVFVLWSVGAQIGRFSDPCYEWGMSSSGSRRVTPGGPCTAFGGTSETKAGAIVRMGLVHGLVLLACALAVAGTLLRRPGISVLGAGLMFLETAAAIFSVPFVPPLLSGLFLLAARGTAPLGAAAKLGARVLGSVAALAAILYLRFAFSAAPLFLWFFLATLAFVAAAGWWPVRKTAETPSL